MAKRLPVPVTAIALIFVLAVGGIMDLFGLSERLTHFVLTSIFLFIPALAGIRQITSDGESFFVAARQNANTQNSAALAGVLSGLSLLLLTGGVQGEVVALVPAIPVSLIVISLLSGNYIRAGSAFSLRQAFEATLKNKALRAILFVAILLISGLLAIAGFEVSVRALESTFGLSRHWAIITGFSAILLLLLLGGAAASMEMLRHAFALTLCALAFPLLLQGLETPVISSLTIRWSQVWLAAAGLAALPVMLMPSQCASNVLEAREGSFKVLALFTIALMILVFLARDALGLGHSDDKSGLMGGLFGPVSAVQSGLESLMAASLILLPLGFTALVVQSFASNLTEGAPLQQPDFARPASLRVARNRLALIFAVGLCAAISWFIRIDPGFFGQIALAASAILLAPAVVAAPTGNSRALFAAFGLAAVIVAAMLWSMHGVYDQAFVNIWLFATSVAALLTSFILSRRKEGGAG